LAIHRRLLRDLLPTPDETSRAAPVKYAALAIMAAVALAACDMVPNKPEAVYILYRDRMKAEKLDEARDLLSDKSRDLSVKLSAVHKLKQPPENLALLNVLDPVSLPTLMKAEGNEVILQVRSLKGGLRLVHLARKDANSPWKIEISEELQALGTYLGARSALDTMREQAGEYAASWKAFNNQLNRMNVSEGPPEKAAPAETSTAPKEKKRTPKKPAKKQKANR